MAYGWWCMHTKISIVYSEHKFQDKNQLHFAILQLFIRKLVSELEMIALEEFYYKTTRITTVLFCVEVAFTKDENQLFFVLFTCALCKKDTFLNRL